MKTLVAFVSETGNTKKVAEAVYSVLSEEKVLSEIKNVQKVEEFDLVFIGFPINAFEPEKSAIEFMGKLLQRQNVVLFTTHAVTPEMPLYTKQLEKAKEYVAAQNCLGIFDCRGELSESIANVLLQSDNKEMQFFGKMRPETIGHPTYEELEAAKEFAVKVQNIVR